MVISVFGSCHASADEKMLVNKVLFLLVNTLNAEFALSVKHMQTFHHAVLLATLQSGHKVKVTPSKIDRPYKILFFGVGYPGGTTSFESSVNVSRFSPMRVVKLALYDLPVDPKTNELILGHYNNIVGAGSNALL